MVLNYILLDNIFWKTVVYTFTPWNSIYSFCALQGLWNSNDTPKVNIHKYTNCNMIKIYINRLSTTKQVFMAMDYSIMMSEKYFHFRKRQKNLAKTFFSHPVEVTGSMNFGNIFRIICSSDFSKICTKTWKKLK